MAGGLDLAMSGSENGARAPGGFGRRALRWFTRQPLQHKLVAATLLLALTPLFVYSTVAARFQRERDMAGAREALEFATMSILRLCEAQEALNRFHESRFQMPDGVSGATMGWREGGQFKSLRDVVREVRVGRHGESVVFDGEGHARIHPRLAEGVSLDRDGPDAATTRELLEVARALGPGQVALRQIAWASGGLSAKRLAAVGYFAPYDWVVLVAEGEADILAEYHRGRRAFLVLFVVTVALILVGVQVLSAWMMRPIVALTAATEVVAEGGDNVSLPRAPADDEIGRLTRAFARMVEQLAAARENLLEWNRTLEEKVEARARELETARDRVLESEKMASLGKMAAMVAHEINNPLSGVLSYVKVCRKLIDAEPTPERLDAIRRHLDSGAAEIRRVGDIVRNLLMFAKRTFGEFATGPLNEIIRRAAGLVRHGMDMKNIAFEQDLSATELTLVHCDASGLEQVLVALFVNAMDAMEPGGRLLVSTDYENKDEVRIRVHDTGKGIEPDLLPHIFEPFFTSKTSGKSIGMGLAVVWGVVRAHHGRAKVNSTPGIGTTFTITLPLRGPSDEAGASAFGRVTHSGA